MKPTDRNTVDRRLLTTEQVADLLVVTPKTVRRWIAAGELPATKLHRQWRVRTVDVDAILESDRDAA